MNDKVFMALSLRPRKYLAIVRTDLDYQDFNISLNSLRVEKVYLMHYELESFDFSRDSEYL